MSQNLDLVNPSKLWSEQRGQVSGTVFTLYSQHTLGFTKTDWTQVISLTNKTITCENKNVSFCNKYQVKKTHTHTRIHTYNQATDVWTGKEKSGGRKQHCAKAGPSLCVILSSVLQVSGFLHSVRHWAAGWPDSACILSSLSSSSALSLASLAMANACTCLISQRDCDLWECWWWRSRIQPGEWS